MERKYRRPTTDYHFFYTFSPVYTGPGEPVHLAFVRDRRNWTSFRTEKCASLRPALFRSQTCTLSHSAIRPVPRGTVQDFVCATSRQDPCKRGLWKSFELSSLWCSCGRARARLGSYFGRKFF